MIRLLALAGLLYGIFGWVVAVEAAQEGLRTKSNCAPFPVWPTRAYVNDMAGLLTPAEVTKLNKRMWIAEEGTEIEIAILTVPSARAIAGLSPKSLDEFAKEAMASYQVGGEYKPNGILLIVFQEEKEARIALGATYQNFRDPDTARILKKVIQPILKRGNYSKAIFSGIGAIESEFLGAYFQKVQPWNWKLIGIVALVIAVPALLLFLYNLCTEGTAGWGGEVLNLAGHALFALLWVFAALLGPVSPSLVHSLMEIFGDSSSTSRSHRGSWGIRNP
ncbi:MAG: TPM domain-containing protein [Planctomycetaceae bacterium]